MRFLKAAFDLTPRTDVVAQALTSRVAKQAVLRWAGWLPAEGREPEKPVKFSFLFAGGRALWGDGEEPVVLKAGERYRFYLIADVDRLGDEAALRLLEPPGEVRLYLSSASLELVEAEIAEAQPLGRGRYVTVRFKTPALLQYPKPPRVKAPSVQTLYPQPRLLVLNLLQRARRYGVEAPLSLYVYAP
ncbi:MAG: hypothetical protein ACP5MH_12205, partial [Thermoproteus sp.]